MTQASQPFSVRACRAQPRPLQTGNFDEETVIRLKKAMVPTFSKMGNDAKALVDGFFTVDPNVKRCSNGLESPFWSVALLRRETRVHLAYDGGLPIQSIDSEHIDWREATRQALDQLLGGDGWPVAFDLCEFLLAKHDEFVKGIVAQEESNRAEEEKYTAPLPSSIAHLLDHSTLRRMENARMRMIREDADNLRKKAIRETNETLERMNVGYRLREQTGRFDSIISAASGAVDRVLALSPASVRNQMVRALAPFGPHSGGERPDYGTAAHKAMNAAWAAMKICTGENKFGVGVRKLQESGKLHPALAAALGSLYGFTSQDGKGMRHPEFEGELPPDMATARFVVETCASFINYVEEIHPDKFTPQQPESENRKD